MRRREAYPLYLDPTQPELAAASDVVYEFSDYANHIFNSRKPASFCYEGHIYKPTKKLGSGSFGEAWLCVTSDLAKSLVLKREIAHSFCNYTEGNEFKHEAEINKKIYGVGALSGDPTDKKRAHYLVMRFIEGIILKDLFNHFAKQAVVSSKVVLRVWILLAAAMIDFHKRGLVHGDLHSGNAIISLQNDFVWLIDFGYTVAIDKVRDDCNIPTQDATKYPFRPPETFSDLRNHVVIAQKNQDIWAAGYHLSIFKKLSTTLPRTQCSNLDEITAELMHLRPTKRMPLDRAICEIISTYFQESLRAMPSSFNSEWIIIVSAIIKMRMNELLVLITQLSESNKKESGIIVLYDSKVQYGELEKLCGVLKDYISEPEQPLLILNHQKFLIELKATTYDSCSFLPGNETIRFVRQVIMSFFPLVSPAQRQIDALLPTRSSTPSTGRQSQFFRTSTPLGIKLKRLYSNTTTIGKPISNLPAWH